MEYILSFLEGIITFISPCILPMLPIYLSYFAGNMEESDWRQSGTQPGRHSARIPNTYRNILGFTAGFTLVFTALGTFTGSIGRLLRDYSVYINLVGGALIIFFGLHFIGILRIPFLHRSSRADYHPGKLGFFSSLLFGIVFAISWTPCAGAFLGSALMLAASSDSIGRGMTMLLAYSLGLAVPFMLSAIFIDRLKSTLAWIKKHYRIINILSGSLLILVGILMMAGWLGYWMALLSF